MTQVLHHRNKTAQPDLHGPPSFLRRHFVTILLLCAMLLAVATSLAL